MRLQAKITYLVNFIRYHFTDNSVFVDHSDISPTEYVTSSYDKDDTGLFRKLYVRRVGGDLQVQDVVSADPDELGNIRGSNWSSVEGRYNILTRDFSCNRSPAGESNLNGITVNGSSFAVVHQIPTVLYPTPIPDWDNLSMVKRYLKRHAIR